MAKKLSDKEKRTKNPRSYIRYSGLAFEMMVTISFFTWLGYKIDKKFKLKYPIFISVLSIGSVFLSLYKLIKKLPKDP